ncbi:MAG: WYL domain-containing protein [Lachnospiraceae bacterium]|nr:WYL domain-containing protein [Lachnospiraceae bacterium]
MPPSTPSNMIPPAPLSNQQSIRDDEKNALHSFDLPLIMAVLKAYSGPENVMSVPEITQKLNAIFPSMIPDDYSFSARNLYRKANLLDDLLNPRTKAYQTLGWIMTILTGGRVKTSQASGIVSGANKNAKGTQNRYYFEPLLDGSDLDMICAGLTSNRFLSEPEKNYLISRLSVLKSVYDPADVGLLMQVYNKLPAKVSTHANKTSKTPESSGHYWLPANSETILAHIQMLYEAIREEQQIEITYGMYDMTEGTRQLDFHPRNPNKPYFLNPYAMIWNNGEYYLIATHYGYENPVHFRIDRILEIRPHKGTKKDKDGNITEKVYKRRPIPPTLAPFFHRKNGVLEFDAIKYTNTYPAMKIYGEQDLVDCHFECTTITLQILIDHFGNKIKLKETPIAHPEEELDVNGNPKNYIKATVLGVQRENAIDFAVEHSNTLTLIDPPELVDEVRNKIKEIYEKYERLQ